MAARTPALPPQSEARFQRQVIEYAARMGWRTYHTYDSRRSAHGFPDAVFVRRPRILFAEFKRQDGKVSDAQQFWLADLGGCPGVETFLWRPSDWPEIARILR